MVLSTVRRPGAGHQTEQALIEKNRTFQAQEGESECLGVEESLTGI